MKRMICLMFSLAFLFTGCSSDSSGTNANSITTCIPMDLSYENIAQLDNFKCQASYQGQSMTIDGDHAKELYNLVYSNMIRQEETQSVSSANSVSLVFYSGGDDYYLDDVSGNYGAYHIYEDGLLLFSESPLYSHHHGYESDADLFATVIDMLFNNK